MGEDPLPKRPKLDGPLIGTHNGHFHADEALAVYLLRLLPTYSSSPLLRTRDAEKLATCHTVVDVGGQYDVSANRFDHHQREFDATFPGHKTKLSSAGLVYLHFGKAIIAQQTGLAESSPEADVLWEKIYKDFVEAFDANDNGVDKFDMKAVKSAGIPKGFEDRGYSIAAVVNRKNWHWDGDAGEKSAEQKQEEEDARFLKASVFTGEEFVAELQDKYRSWLPARGVVQTAYNSRFTHHPSGQIMVIPHRKEGVPWSDHLYTLESLDSSPTKKPVLYVLFAESDQADSKWRIRAVSVEGGGFVNRKDLPDAWKGVRDEELDRVSGIPGGVFVHAGGFIGGNKTFEGALEMARKAVEL